MKSIDVSNVVIPRLSMFPVPSSAFFFASFRFSFLYAIFRLPSAFALNVYIVYVVKTFLCSCSDCPLRGMIVNRGKRQVRFGIFAEMEIATCWSRVVKCCRLFPKEIRVCVCFFTRITSLGNLA